MPAPRATNIFAESGLDCFVPSPLICALALSYVHSMADGAPAQQQKRLEIKKYANRRYYDATHSRHLTLEEIRSLIQQGYDIKVVDAKTSADITGQVLTQIILELDTPKLDSLPVPLLVRLIRMNDGLVKDFVEKYFNQALQSFQDYQRHWEEQVRRGLSGTVPNMSQWTKAMLAPFAAAFGDRSEPPEQPAKPGPAPKASNNEDVRALIRELQAQVAELKNARIRQKRKPRNLRKTKA